MMECPRCGFSQPKDRYCASCGLDVESYLARPKPIWVRLLQNPNFHLSLIGFLILGMITWIIYSRSGLMRHHVEKLLDVPLSSREAAVPGEEPVSRPSQRAVDPVEAGSARSSGPAPAATEGAADAATAPPAPKAAETRKDAQRVIVTYWEIPRDTLANLLNTAERLTEGTGGRAYIFKDSDKAFESLRASGQRISTPRMGPLNAGAMVSIETPPTAAEPFQYGLYTQVNKWENREAALSWSSTLVLPQPESAQEMANPRPAVRASLESTLNGTANLNASQMILLVMEPANRTPREEYLTRAGQGPWSVFASQEFRAGLTDWVISIHLK